MKNHDISKRFAGDDAANRNFAMSSCFVDTLLPVQYFPYFLHEHRCAFYLSTFTEKVGHEGLK